MSYSRPRHYPYVHRMFYTLLPYSYDPIAEKGNPWGITANLSLDRTKSLTFSGKELWQHIATIGPIQRGISDQYSGFNYVNSGPGLLWLIEASVYVLIYCNPVHANYPYDRGYRIPHYRNLIQEYIPQITVGYEARLTDFSAVPFPIPIHHKLRQYIYGLIGAPYLEGQEAVVQKSVLPSIWHKGVTGEDEYTISTSDLTADQQDQEFDNRGSYAGHPGLTDIATVISECETIVDNWSGQGVYRMAAHQIPRDFNRVLQNTLGIRDQY